MEKVKSPDWELLNAGTDEMSYIVKELHSRKQTAPPTTPVSTLQMHIALWAVREQQRPGEHTVVMKLTASDVFVHQRRRFRKLFYTNQQSILLWCKMCQRYIWNKLNLLRNKKKKKKVHNQEKTKFTSVHFWTTWDMHIKKKKKKNGGKFKP